MLRPSILYFQLCLSVFIAGHLCCKIDLHIGSWPLKENLIFGDVYIEFEKVKKTFVLLYLMLSYSLKAILLFFF